MSVSKAPFAVRWRNGVMDDANPVLTWKALVAAMALVRHADVRTGHNCYPGAEVCARQMRVSRATILRGWDELKEAGWLEIKPLPASRRRTQGALKVLRFPASETRLLTATKLLSGPQLVADSNSTITGNQGAFQAPGEASQPLAGCSMCGRRAALDSGLCRKCFEGWYGDGRTFGGGA